MIRSLLATCVLLCTSVTAQGGNAGDVVVTHYEPLGNMRLSSVGTAPSARKAGVGPITLRFDALGQSFHLELHPNAKILTAISTRYAAKIAIPYRGGLAGIPGSWASITMVNSIPAGLIWDGNSLYAIESPGDSIVDTTAPIIYDLDDAFVVPGALRCGGSRSVSGGLSVYRSIVNDVATAAANTPGASFQLNLGVVADFEFTSSMGANAEPAVIARLNNVDAIYTDQLGLQINLPVIETFTQSNDPFSSTRVPNTLLSELILYRQATPAQSSQGVTLLYTGRDLEDSAGGVLGVAAGETICHPDYGTAVSTGTNGVTIDSLVAVHEVAHVFGAIHDGYPGSPCEHEPDTYIMAPNQNGSSHFSGCSISMLQARMATATCVTPIDSTDIAISFGGAPQTVLLGRSASVVVNVVNNSSLPSQNVVADIELPNNAVFESASASTGVCTNGGGFVSCQLGSVASSSATSVSITVNTTTPGIGTFDATVVADIDDNAGNNRDSLQFTVDPAVNIVIDAPPLARINVNQSADVMMTIQNDSFLNATSVVLSVSFGAGLRVNSASWPNGACVINTRQVDCTNSQIDSQSTLALRFNVTGIAAGTHDYTATISAAEPDTDEADNNVDGLVQVVSDSGGDRKGNGTSGGGSVGFIYLGVLAACMLQFALHGCATEKSAVVQKLDEQTAVTISYSRTPHILSPDGFFDPAAETDFVQLGVIEVNRMGSRRHYVWLGIADLETSVQSSENLADYESIVLVVDGQNVPLSVSGWMHEEIGVSEPVYKKLFKSAADAYYRVTVEQIALLTNADDIALRLRGDKNGRFVSFGGQAAARSDLAEFYRTVIQ